MKREPGVDAVRQAQARAAALQARYAHIARTRMAGVPVLNRRLQVEAVGFEPLPACSGHGEEAPPSLLGVLVTPWFMNLVWLPLQADDRDDGVGRVRRLELAGQCFDFIGAHEPGLGAHAACSLFSPMDDFGNAAAARLTARAVLDLLRQARPGAIGAGAADMATSSLAQTTGQAPAPTQVQSHAQSPLKPTPQRTSPASRRGFLFGRSAAPGAGA